MKYCISRYLCWLFLSLLLFSCSDDGGTIQENLPPSTPANLVSSNVVQNSATLSWNSSTDVDGIEKYQVYVNGSIHTNVPGTSSTINGLVAGTSYTCFVRAVDNKGLLSSQSNTIQFTTLDNCDSSGTLFPGQTGLQLLSSIKDCFKPTNTYSYSQARDFMYTDIDVWDDGMIHTVYTDFKISVNVNSDAKAEALSKGVNTEHVFPRSMGANQDPARSDIFHLFPSREGVNGYRSNKAFGEITDNTVDRWYYLDQLNTSVPSTGIDNYSEGTTTKWEPREEIKGDIARAVFYFYTIHNNVANKDFFDGMRADLLAWHAADPVSTRELQRNNKIKTYQGNNNPYIVQPALAARVFD